MLLQIFSKYYERQKIEFIFIYLTSVVALNVIWDFIRVFLPKVITKIVGKISVRNCWEDRNQDQDHNDIRILLHFVGNCRCISTALSWIFSLMNVLFMNLKIFFVVINLEYINLYFHDGNCVLPSLRPVVMVSMVFGTS